MIAFSKRRSYDLSYPDARPWLFGILTKLVARHHRSEATRYRALLRAPVEAEVESPPTGWRRGERPGRPR